MDPINWPGLVSAATARVSELRGAEATLDAVKVAAGLAREHAQALARRDAAKADAAAAETAFAEAKAKWDAEYAATKTRHDARLTEFRQTMTDVERQKAETLADYAQAKKAMAKQFEVDTATTKAAFDSAHDALMWEIAELTSRRDAAQTALDALKRA